MSLRARLALLFAVVAVAGVLAASVASYAATRHQLDTEVTQFLDRRTDEIVQGNRATPRGAPDANPPAIAVEPDAIVQILDQRGDVATSTGARLPVDDTEQRIARTGGAPVERTVEVDGVKYRMRTMALRREGLGGVQVARSLDEIDAVLAALRARLALVGLIVAAVAAGAGYLVARRTTEPLRRLAATAEHVATTGRLDVKVATDASDEVGGLSRSLDSMLGALATSREQQHRLVQDAGHELRTPLTALRTDVGLLRRAPDYDPDKRQELVASIEAEVVELSDLVTELIDLATDAHDDEPPQQLDLADVVSEAVARFSRRSDRAVTVDAVASPVVGRRDLLDRAVTNLLGNAHKFSPPAASVEVLVRGGTVVVRDHGPGIPVAERPLVFERFYRGATARSAPGSGLGLAIVAQAVARHGGTVHVGDTAGGGAEVGFTIPQSPAASSASPT
jgi:two-component system sensor histidine kinase MprB